MPSEYTVVQLIKGLRGEAANIGIIAVGDEEVSIKWLSSDHHHRLAAFYEHEDSIISERLNMYVKFFDGMAQEKIKQYIVEFPTLDRNIYSDIQFTPWRGSLLTATDCINSIWKDFL